MNNKDRIDQVLHTRQTFGQSGFGSGRMSVNSPFAKAVSRPSLRFPGRGLHLSFSAPDNSVETVPRCTLSLPACQGVLRSNGAAVR